MKNFFLTVYQLKTVIILMISRYAIWAVMPLLMTFTNGLRAAEAVKLAAPNFSDENILNKKLATSVSRYSFVIKSEVRCWNERPIIFVHSYGFGQSAWSYAPGSMEIAYENMLKAYTAIGRTRIPSKDKIAVLGAGASSLMIANQLAQDGHAVTVYAEKFSPNTSSDIYSGIFVPFLNRKQRGDEISERLELLSYKAYESLANQKHRGVQGIDFYLINDLGSFDFLVKKGLVSQTAVQMGFDNNTSVDGVKYRSFILDTPLIMRQMMHRARSLGVKFVKKRFNETVDFMGLDADVVFNFIGLSSNEDVNEAKIGPLIAHTISLRDTAGVNYAFLANHPDGTYTYWLSNNEKMTIAGTFLEANQEEASEEMHVQRLFDRAKKLLADKDK